MKKHVLKLSEWKTGSGCWWAGDVENVASRTSCSWVWIIRLLNLSPTDFILLLKDKYHAQNFRFFKDKNLLLWNWKNYNDCHAFVLFVNKEAKKKNFIVW